MMTSAQAGTPVICLEPTGSVIPLVCDSPHSGTVYPSDFGHAVPLAQLRQGEDTHVEALWESAPRYGATLIAATFPRTYIDPNRSLTDLDPDALEGVWPEALVPGPKTRLGKGLVWTRMDARTPVYARKLTVAEVQHRIDSCYRPYHQCLADAVRARYEEFGALWHLNLHSMPNDAYARLGIQSERPLADFVLGDRDGTTCDPEFVDLVANELKKKGYTVACNDPYKGVELIAQIGSPAEHRNSLQIEIRRPVYMDENNRGRNSGFYTLQRDIDSLLATTAEYIASKVTVQPSEG